MMTGFKKITTSMLLLTTAWVVSNAQEATVQGASVATTSDNTLLYIMVSVAGVLLLAILLLSNTLLTLTQLVVAKRKQLTSVLLLVFLSAVSMATSVDQSASSAIKIDLNLWTGIVVVAAEVLVIFWLLFMVQKMINELSGKKKEVKPIYIQLPHIFDNINASVPIEQEKDILLDHNYDGIRELDNSLPPWWKYSFYISIVWSIAYLSYFYFGGGPSSTDEYRAEVLQAKIDIEEYNRKNANNVDENNVKLADVLGITDGRDIFTTNCTPCHGNLGEGNNVGPNLTDKYWLHGGTLNNVFKSIKYGWPAKGMKSWESDLSNTQIRNVASFIHSIQGSNPPNAKDPQGDLMVEENTSAPEDSTVQADVSAVK